MPRITKSELEEMLAYGSDREDHFIRLATEIDLGNIVHFMSMLGEGIPAGEVAEDLHRTPTAISLAKSQGRDIFYDPVAGKAYYLREVDLS